MLVLVRSGNFKLGNVRSGYYRLYQVSSG